MPTIICAAAMMAVMVASILRPVGVAWGDETGVQPGPIERAEDARDRVEPRTPRDVEMLRRLLEMTMQAMPAGNGAPVAPAGGSEATPTNPAGPPQTSATGTEGARTANGSVG